MLGTVHSMVGRAALAATIALTLGFTACGESDEATGGSAEDDGTKAQISAVLTGIQKAFVENDPNDFCAGLTTAGRKEVANDPFQPGDSCEEVVAHVARVTRKAGVRQRPSIVQSVKVRGNEATAMVTNGGRPPAPVEFAKEDGEWRLVSAGLGFKPKTPENADQKLPEELRQKLLHGKPSDGG